MSTTRFSGARILLLLACSAISARATADDQLFRPFSLISGSEQLTAVSSRVYAGYTRERNANGTFRDETYALGNGGSIVEPTGGADVGAISMMGAPRGGGVVSDPTIDDMTFDSIARTLWVSLAEQRYVPTRNPNNTKLLIMVFWGRTYGSYQDQDGSYKDYIDAVNAHLLGFDSERFITERTDVSTAFFGRSFRSLLMDNVHSADITALQMDRYYVILRAFDFQTAWKQRKPRLLWETRFSLSERQHDFSKELPTMAHTASQYFGQDTKGLIRARIPEGQVEIGTVKSLGNVPGN
jgi:hypothetical protein